MIGLIADLLKATIQILFIVIEAAIWIIGKLMTLIGNLITKRSNNGG